ncbi:MAG: hypothetical protein K2O28_02670 [Clostridia bacterium]|nr:hypothetical protein [Clostridia bacterium]
MKKILFLLTSLLAVSSALCFTGCNDKGNTDSGTENENVRTRISSVEDDENDDTCPDCEKHGMPKVRFEFKDGRPACKGDKDGVEPPHERHHKKHPHPPKKPRPAPPEDGGQDKNEN